MLYGAEPWDPWRIVAQIVAVQCIYYLSLGLLLAILVGPYAPATPALLFDWRASALGAFEGWAVAGAFLLAAAAAGGALRLVVQRAKRCLDFAATLHLLHLLIVAARSGFPARLGWWALTGAGLAATATLGEWLCIQQELREIPLASIPRPAAGAGGAGGSGSGRAGVELSSVKTAR